MVQFVKGPPLRSPSPKQVEWVRQLKRAQLSLTKLRAMINTRAVGSNDVLAYNTYNMVRLFMGPGDRHGFNFLPTGMWYVNNILQSKHFGRSKQRQKKGDFVYCEGMAEFDKGRGWIPYNLQICDDQKVAAGCINRPDTAIFTRQFRLKYPS